jgi:hypothetical protein
VPQLCDEVIVTTERLRFAAATFTQRAPWSAHATSQSWRRDALASAITGHCGELILDTLAHRAADLGLHPFLQDHLHQAADATRHAWTAWRAVAMEWDLLSTGINRRHGLSRVAIAADDLVLRLGRMAYSNPGWTPACGDASIPQTPADLAPGDTYLRNVLAAVHRAMDAVTQIAIQDRYCVHGAFTEGRLYTPTRLLPADYDIPYRYTPTPASRAQPLLNGYDLAVQTSSTATAALDNLAIAAETPSRALAIARQLTPLHAPGQGYRKSLRHQGRQANAAPPVGHLEHSLRDLHISDPDLLLRAASIDEATRDITGEAITKANRRETIVDHESSPALAMDHRPSPRPMRPAI